jgi:hypothetical protein
LFKDISGVMLVLYSKTRFAGAALMGARQQLRQSGSKKRNSRFEAKYPEVVDGITRFCLSNDFSTATPDKTVTKYYDKYGKVQNGTRRNISPNCFFTCATIEESM